MELQVPLRKVTDYFLAKEEALRENFDDLFLLDSTFKLDPLLSIYKIGRKSTEKHVRLLAKGEIQTFNNSWIIIVQNEF